MEYTQISAYQQVIPSLEEVIAFFKENGVEEERYAKEWYTSMENEKWSYKGKKIMNWRKFSRFTLDRVIKYINSVKKEQVKKLSKIEPEMVLAQNIQKMYFAYNGYKPDAYTTEVYKLLTKVKQDNEFSTEALVDFVENRLEGLKDFDYINVERLLLE